VAEIRECDCADTRSKNTQLNPRHCGAVLDWGVPFNNSMAAPENKVAWRANNQKTTRQEPASANNPPKRGASTVAIPQTLEIEAKTRARCRSGKSSATATIASPEIKPLPNPWRSRPAKKRLMVGATALRAHPAASTRPPTEVAERKPIISETRPALAPARMAPRKKPAVAQPSRRTLRCPRRRLA
jgi:hypothetical protein